MNKSNKSFDLISVTGALTNTVYVINANLISVFYAGQTEDGINGTYILTDRLRSDGTKYPYFVKETPEAIKVMLLEQGL